MILAIDPGPEQSAYVLYDAQNRGLQHQGWKGKSFAKLPNVELLDMVRTKAKRGDRGDSLAVEMIASYGMPVGREVFEACVVIGKIAEAWESWGRSCERITRGAIKLHLCGSMRAKDANVRQALIDAFGGKEKAIGNKKQPGPLYGVKADVWAALAVAVTYADQLEQMQEAA